MRKRLSDGERRAIAGSREKSRRRKEEKEGERVSPYMCVTSCMNSWSASVCRKGNALLVSRDADPSRGTGNCSGGKERIPVLLIFPSLRLCDADLIARECRLVPPPSPQRRRCLQCNGSPDGAVKCLSLLAHAACMCMCLAACFCLVARSSRFSHSTPLCGRYLSPQDVMGVHASRVKSS